MFNPSPSSSRSAKPWQAASNLLSHVDETGFAVGAWAKADARGFADADLKLAARDFAARQYEPVQQPLLQKTLAALSQLDEDVIDSFDKPKKKAGGYQDESPNAHLPFVPDVYVPLGQKKKAQAPALPKRTANWADHIETIVHEDLLGDAPAHELIAAHDQQAVAQDEVQASQAPEPQAAEAVQAASEVEHLGIDPAELARREAVQFDTGHAQGLIQGREEGLTQGRSEGHQAGLEEGLAQGKAQGLSEGREEGLAQGRTEGLHEGRLDGFDKGVALGRAEGLQEGYEAGRAEGHEQGLAEGREEGHAQGLEQGLAQGEQKAKDSLADEMAAQRKVFDETAQQLQALLDDPKQFFEPMKRLALHLAEQLVLGELTASPQAMERLVQRCLDELDHPAQGVVVLELHPDDKARLQKHGGELTRGMRLEAVHDMQPGSVRVLANDTVVEDLVENRLHALVQGLHIDEAAWRKQSTLLAPEPSDAKESVQIEEPVESDDAHS